MLFLNKQPDTTYFYLVNDDGRYTIDSVNRITGIGKDTVAKTLDRLSLTDLRGIVNRAMRAR